MIKHIADLVEDRLKEQAATGSVPPAVTAAAISAVTAAVAPAVTALAGGDAISTAQLKQLVDAH